MDITLPKDPRFNKYYTKHCKHLNLKGLKKYYDYWSCCQACRKRAAPESINNTPLTPQYAISFLFKGCGNGITVVKIFVLKIQIVEYTVCPQLGTFFVLTNRYPAITHRFYSIIIKKEHLHNRIFYSKNDIFLERYTILQILTI